MTTVEIRMKYNKAHFDAKPVAGIDLKEYTIRKKTVRGKKVEYFITDPLVLGEDYHLSVWFQSSVKDKKFTCLMIAPPGYVLRYYDTTKKFERREVSWTTLAQKKRRLVQKRFYLEEK